MANSHKPQSVLTASQLQVMHVVWDAGGGATVADVWQALSKRRQIARNTVQTTLVRLEERGWLRHVGAAGEGFRYFARKPRASTLGSMVKKLVETAFAGSADGLVMALLDERGVSKEEAARIRQLIDRAEIAGQAGKGK